MKAEDDLTELKSSKNSYASKLKNAVTMWLSEDVVTRFKVLAAEAGMPDRNVATLFLREGLAPNRKAPIQCSPAF